MKKLIFSLLLMLASQGIFAQLDWTQLSEEYSRMHILADRVGEQTDKVVSDESGVRLIGSNGPVVFERQVDLNAAKEHFKYKLIKSDGMVIPLDKVLTETVIKKFTTILNTVNESLKVDRGAQVQDILSDLF